MTQNQLTSNSTISWQLEIKANNKILIPGCEPTSSLSSKTLAAAMAKNGCGSALIDVQVIINTIPGSFVKYGSNFGRGGYRQRWLVLPPFKPGCPCEPYPDYYAILRSLATDDVPVETKFDACDINGMGYCPHPDFKLAEPPPTDPYQQETKYYNGVGLLPPLPPWAGDYQTSDG